MCIQLLVQLQIMEATLQPDEAKVSDQNPTSMLSPSASQQSYTAIPENHKETAHKNPLRSQESDNIKLSSSCIFNSGTLSQIILPESVGNELIPKKFDLDCKIQIKKNHQEQSNANEMISWAEQNQFKKENTQWSNFILVYNPMSQADCFYCGRCKEGFKRIIEFMNHCLGENCGQFCNVASSHFIIALKTWQSFLSKQIKANLTSKKKKLKKSKKDSKNESVESSISNEEANGAQSRINSEKLREERVISQSKLKISEQTQTFSASLGRFSDIINFTKTITNFWEQSNLKTNFVFNQHYYVVFGMVFLLNPLLQNYEGLNVKVCPICNIKCHINTYRFNYHYNEKCSKINTLQSRYLVLNAKLFYAYLINSKLYNLSAQPLDLTLLAYIHENTAFISEEINYRYSKMKYYLNFIKIYYHLFDGIILSCSLCDYKSSVDDRWKEGERHLKVKQHCTKFEIDTKHNQSPKIINIHLYEEYLKDQFLYCPCQEFKTRMTLPQFISHLKENHSKEPLKIFLYKCLL